MLQEKPFIFVNVGARDEEHDAFLGKNAPFKLEIIGFEPDPDEFDRLNKAQASNQESRIIKKFYPYALAATSERRPLYLFKDRRLSSMLKPNAEVLNKFPIAKLLSNDAFKIDETIYLETRALDSIYQSTNGNMPHFIKIDTQGTELDILKGAEKILDTCFALLIEVEFVQLYENQPTFTDIDLYLRSRGFTLINIDRVLWKRDVDNTVSSNGQVIFGDALYFRDVSNIKDQKQEQFFKQLSSDHELALKTLWAASQLGYSDIATQMLASYTENKLISNADADYFKRSIQAKYEPVAKPSFIKRAIKKIDSRIHFLPKKKNEADIWVNEHYYFKDKF